MAIIKAMIEVSVGDAKTRLTELLRAVEGGARVVVTRHGKPVAELRALEPAKREPWSVAGSRAHLRALGHELNEIPVPDDFDAPLPDRFWLGGER